MADLAIWAVSRTVQIAKDVVTQLLAHGATMVELVADTLAHPTHIKNLMQAFLELGKTMKDIVNAAIVQPAEDAARQALKTLKELGKSALDVLIAAADIGASALGTVFTLILEWFPGSYRPLNKDERNAADPIFVKSIPLDQVRLAVLSIPVDVIEFIEEKATGQAGRAFTTMTLINFPSWQNLTLDTVVHELTHVWQNFQVGPIYMVEALEAQFSKDKYNYGYNENTEVGFYQGEEAQTALNNAKGNFNAFNREQQATIIQHFYARKNGLPKTDKHAALPPREFTEWQPYADLVKNAIAA